MAEYLSVPKNAQNFGLLTNSVRLILRSSAIALSEFWPNKGLFPLFVRCLGSLIKSNEPSHETRPIGLRLKIVWRAAYKTWVVFEMLSTTVNFLHLERS